MLKEDNARRGFVQDADGVDSAVTYHASAAGWLVDSHRIIELSFDNRSGETAWRWDLDAPCS